MLARVCSTIRSRVPCKRSSLESDIFTPVVLPHKMSYLLWGYNRKDAPTRKRSHVKQAEAWKIVLFQQLLLDELFEQLINLCRRHLAAIRSEFAIGLCARRDYF